MVEVWSKCGRKPCIFRLRPQLKALNHCTLDGGCGRVVEIFIKTKITGAHQKKRSRNGLLSLYLWYAPDIFERQKTTKVPIQISYMDDLYFTITFLP